MIPIIDSLLDRITMYRLLLYFLLFLLTLAIIFSFFGILPYDPLSIMYPSIVLLIVGAVTNIILAKVCKAPTNIESSYISILILSFLISPTTSFDLLLYVALAAVITMASKFIFVYKKKHVFNPVAIGMVIMGYAFGQPAAWWVTTAPLIPFVVIGGLLIVRKIRRFDLVFSYLVTSILVITVTTLIYKGDLLASYKNAFLQSSLFFLAFVMLTEPQTTPPTRKLRMIYGALVGLLYIPQVHVGNFYSTPELALVLGNVFSFIVSPKYKLLLHLKEKNKIAPMMTEFIFMPSEKVIYHPGQYMEWTLPNTPLDMRGNRRFFTIASSPTEDTLRLGVRFEEKGSSFKKVLSQLTKGTPIVASQLAGDFTLREDPKTKYVFMAGGIGITPFRSMMKYLIDTKEKKDAILFYSNKDASEIVYKDIFNEAEKTLGIRTIYTLTDKEHVAPNWKGRVGRIDEKMLKEEVSDYKERVFYISGPHSMVTAYEKLLLGLGISRDKIVIDYFPGFV